MKRTAIWVLATVMALALTFAVFTANETGSGPVERKTVTDSIVYDTVEYRVPVPYDSVVIRYETQKLPVAVKEIYTHSIDTVVERVTDSVEVVIPITQKTYQDSTYKAVVSGYMANLDVIEVYPKTVYRTTTITKKPKKFGVGVQAGYGVGEKGFSPYVGVGISYNIFSW